MGTTRTKTHASSISIGITKQSGPECFNPSPGYASLLLERLDDLGLEQYPILIEHLLHGRFDLDEAEALLSRHSERSEVVQRVVEGGEDLMAVEVELGLYQF